MRNRKSEQTKYKRFHILIQAAILTALAILLIVPAYNVSATGQAVNVWFSSEYNPCNSGWYTNSSWENNITYKLSQQPDITVTGTGGASMTTINVYPNTQYQTVYGIGTSLEESTVYNLMLMSASARDICLKQLFTTQNNGINMNLARVCIGTSDFTSRTFYTYDDGAADPSLSRFSIQKDIDYNIINVLKQANSLNPNLKYFGSPWSPPGWMKTSGNIIGGSINATYIPTFATYLRKFVQAYAAQGVAIDALTLQNEPLFSPADYPGCTMTSANEASLVKSLRTELNNNGYSGVKLMVFDHNFDSAASYVSGIFSDSAAQSSTEGVAFHDYAGDPSAMTTVHNSYPSKSMYLTERTVWGTSGANRIVQYFRNWARSYNCWVTMLDSNIKPEQWSGTPDPTMLVQSASSRDTYWRTPEFYIMGQFSRYIQRNAIRINSDAGSTGTITNVAFLNPDNTIVLVAVNQNSSSQQFKVVCNGEQFIATVPAKTVATYKWIPGSSGGSTPTPTKTPTPTPTQSSTIKQIPGTIEAENYNAMFGVQTESCTEGGLNVGYIETGDWMDFNVNVNPAGSYTVEYRVASTGTTGKIDLRIGSTTLATTSVPNTGGWQNWTTVSATVNLSAGAQTLRLYASGGGFNVNWLRFTSGGGGATPTPTATQTTSVIFNNFDTNQGYSAGPNATVTYNSSGKNVMLVTSVSADPGNANQCVKVVPQSGSSVNASPYINFSFWIDDTQGNNTIKVTMVDTAGAVWSAWTSAQSVKNTWLGITVPMSSVTGINKAAIKEIRIGEWNSGTYYIDGLQFNN